MAGRYRALLIGNSTYPADEHNLQQLKGPVKDIAVLNRALVDPKTGLFDDVDVTLLPETSANRAMRALGKFFGTANRDDVLLLYFSGHGKLDLNGRLHLCMQDTETTDLLSTAVSSTRINEFADASRARNVVIILDCCYAGAFRGGDFGDAVAGPGRYVLSSCRGTQLANDATVDNGTSYFTQHVVDGLLTAAVDHDGDGYVGFSDLYGYVDRRLRDAGKQIPQRRVDGDGDVRLAMRERQPVAEVTATVEPPSAPDVRPRRRRPSRRVVGAAAAGVIVLGGGTVAALVLLQNGSETPSTPSLSVSGNSVTTNGPWRLRIVPGSGSAGCLITLTDRSSRVRVPLELPENGIYTPIQLQIKDSGSFEWQTNDPGCHVTPVAGSGAAVLPFVQEGFGDTDAFSAPDRVSVQVTDFGGDANGCDLRLFDPSNAQELDKVTAKPGAATVQLDPRGSKRVYLHNRYCVSHLSASS
jgi:hypothetical protein